jgi:predicted methyltransferase
MKYKLIEVYPGGGELGDIISKSAHPDAGENIYYYCQQWFDPSKYPKNWEEVIPDRVYSASDILEAVNNWSLDTVELKHINKFLDREYNGV